MCILTHWEPKLVKITQVYLSDHLINIGVDKYGLSAFKRRVARIFSSPGCNDPLYRMTKFLTYIWEYFLITCGCRFYTLLVPEVTLFVA